MTGRLGAATAQLGRFVLGLAGAIAAEYKHLFEPLSGVEPISRTNGGVVPYVASSLGPFSATAGLSPIATALAVVPTASAEGVLFNATTSGLTVESEAAGNVIWLEAL